MANPPRCSASASPMAPRGYHRGRKAVPRPRRKPHRSAEPDPLARPHPALAAQDGVPGISGPPIPAGGSADYDFPLRFGGAFWMHSHQGLQEQSLMLAPLIIHDERDRLGQQEIVVMLNDFSFTPPAEILAGLKKGGSMPSMARKAAPMASMTGMTQAAAGPDLN